MRAAALALLLLTPVLADQIVLKNGKKYTGTFVDADGMTVKFRVRRRKDVRSFSASDVSRLDIGKRAARKQPAKATPAGRSATAPAPPPPPLTVPKFGVGTLHPLDDTGEIDTEYTRVGEDVGVLGPPTAPQQHTADGRASVRFYAHGAIYWTGSAGAHAIYGPIFDAWIAQGGERSVLGYPTSDEDDAESGFTRRQTFQHGSIVWTPNGAVVHFAGQ